MRSTTGTMACKMGWTIGTVVLLALYTPGAAAQGEPNGQFLGLQAHGFASQGFLLTTGNEYLVTDSKKGSFQFSEVGLNFTRDLTERLRFGAQFLAQNFGPAGSYTPKVDWFYLDHRVR